MNRLLPGIIRPFPDEVLSSWVNRGLQRNKDRRFDNLLSLFHANNILDCDGKDSVVASMLLVQIFGQPVEHFMNMFPAKDYWVNPIGCRRLYCTECVIEDVRRGHLPAYRKSWIYRWSLICPVHLTVLSTTARTTANSNETIQLALHYIARNKFTSSWRIKRSMNASKYSACAGFLNISYYFQEWLFQQCKSDSINIPGGQCVDALSFFNMVDAICLSLMRPVGIEEKRISQAYSYLPPRKWPSREAISKGARIIVNRDIGSLEPIEKAGLFSYLGLLVGIPKCCQLWRILGNYSPYYCFPDTRSLFPADSRNLRGLILERLEKENNPLRDTVELWFYLNLRAHRGIKLL